MNEKDTRLTEKDYTAFRHEVMIGGRDGHPEYRTEWNIEGLLDAQIEKFAGFRSPSEVASLVEQARKEEREKIEKLLEKKGLRGKYV
jgi:hypothetical protein